MTPQAIDRLLGRAADNVTAAQQAREHGRPELALGNIKCARDILSAIYDVHHAVDAEHDNTNTKP